MSYSDIFIILPLLYGAYKGFTKGFVMELSILIALFAGVWGAMKFSSFAEGYLREKFQMSEGILHFASFLCVFIAILIVVVLLAKIIEGILDISAMGIFNKIAGAIFGVLKWTFILMILIYFIMPLDARFHFFSADKTKKSYLFEPIKNFSQSVLPRMKGVINETQVKLLNNKSIKID